MIPMHDFLSDMTPIPPKKDRRSACPAQYLVLLCFLLLLNRPELLNAGGKKQKPLDQHAINMNYLVDKTKAANSTILLHNDLKLLPLVDLADTKIASIAIDLPAARNFNDELLRYTTLTRVTVTQDKLSRSIRRNILRRLKNHKLIICSLPAKLLDDPSIAEFFEDIQKSHTLIVCLYGEFGELAKLHDVTFPLLLSDAPQESAARFCAQVIVGAEAISNKLAEEISAEYPKGAGFTTHKTRLSYTVPEDAGIHCRRLGEIDSLVYDAINQGSTPGAVVLVAKDGKIIFEKAYGTWTPDGNQAVMTNDIFDIASITKAAATSLAVMKLSESGELALDKPIADYLPETKKTDKAQLTLRELLIHEAGLVSSIPFRSKVTKKDYRRKYSADYSVRVSENFYLRTRYYESVMWPQIVQSKLYGRGNYRYSDIGMFFVQEIVERSSGKKLDTYVQNTFYGPLGLQSTGYLAYKRFPRARIVPSENDSYFRHSTLRGYVQDPTAAMMGGVSGHAGLFSNASELAIIFQMLLNGGSYGGRRYFEESTVNLFTKTGSSDGRRKLGFDGYDNHNGKKYPSQRAGTEIFGHTGFTGTCVWADPQKNMVYVFLSNRTITGTSNLLNRIEVRQNILDVIYEAM